ncbi:MAG: 2'-5' RNA ligase family protein [Patescibacteria group bacterium]
MKKSDSFNIVILPDKETQSKAVVMSKKVGLKIPTEFQLNSIDLLPHITLYQAQFPLSRVRKMRSEVQDIVNKTKKFEVPLTSISIAYDTFVFWNCQKTNDIQSLHERIVRALNPLRDGLIRPDLLKMKNLSEEDKHDIHVFGALLIRPRYQPHMTITRLVNATDDKKALQLLPKYKSESLKVTEIAFGYLGKHGTVYNIIESFPLQS